MLASVQTRFQGTGGSTKCREDACALSALSLCKPRGYPLITDFSGEPESMSSLGARLAMLSAGQNLTKGVGRACGEPDTQVICS